jgi:2-oxoglutarate dehydrogenase E2 component (dihydrolipoamide succinyltransferase)
MAVQLRVPSLGESIAQATVGAWLKQEGERVSQDEPLVEVESEKATVAVPAPADGVLKRILKQSGATAAVGEVIAEIEEGATAAPSATATPPPTPTATPTAPATTPAVVAVTRLTPSARRLAARAGVAPEVLGPRALGKEEVARSLEARREPAPVETRPPGERERLVPMSPLRRTVARRLLEAQESAAILTTFNEVDMSRVLELRRRHGPTFQEAHGIKLGFMSFFVKAAVEALRAFPVVNAEVRGDAVLYKDHYDIGVAVGGGKGLVVPVVRDADGLSFAEIEVAIADLAAKARDNRITMEDLAGGTFTISNGGVYGSLLSTPILNPPQSGILGLHKIQKRPVAGPDDAVVVRPMMYLALSYDHRIVDGREAVSFLVKLKECIEDPERLLLGI